MPLGRTRRGGEAELRQAAASAPVFQQPTERAAVRCRFLAAAEFRWLHGARGYPCIFLAPIPCEGIEPHSACFQHYGRPTEGRPAMLNVAIVGTFAASLEDAIRGNLTVPCEIVVSDEAGIISLLADIDVLVTMVLTRSMARACLRLRLVQVPGAGLGRIDRSAMPRGAWLANAHGHENGIAEYGIGASGALTRRFGRLDAALRKGDWQSQWAIGGAAPPRSPEVTRKTIGHLGYGTIAQA